MAWHRGWRVSLARCAVLPNASTRPRAISLLATMICLHVQKHRQANWSRYAPAWNALAAVFAPMPNIPIRLERWLIMRRFRPAKVVRWSILLWQRWGQFGLVRTRLPTSLV